MNKIRIEYRSRHAPSENVAITFKIFEKLTRPEILTGLNDAIYAQLLKVSKAGNPGARVHAKARYDRLKNLKKIVSRNFAREKVNYSEVGGGRYLLHYENPIRGYVGDRLVISQAARYFGTVPKVRETKGISRDAKPAKKTPKKTPKRIRKSASAPKPYRPWPHFGC